jgi:predicted permease
VAVISDGFWRRHFGGDRAIIGQTFATDNGSWQVVGVMPSSFSYPVDTPTDMWIPLVIPPKDRVRTPTGYHTSYDLQAVGRLTRGISVEQATARMSSIATSLAPQFPGWFRGWSPVVRPLRDTIVGKDLRSWMLMLLASVTLVLLIACVNVASLMLARAGARGREMGVRAALGASRWRIGRGGLTESLLLSSIGTILGVFSAYLTLDVIRTLLPPNLPRSSDIAVNWRVLTAAATAAIATGLICGVLPALQASKPALNRAVRDGGRSSSSSRSSQRMRATLVCAEVGLAIVLLIGAGLFMSSFIRLTSIDLGVEYDHVLTVGLDRAPTGPARAAAAVQVSAIVSDVLPILQLMPGVESAAVLSGTRPFEDGHDRTNVVVPGREEEFQSSDDAVDVYQVTAAYTTVLGVAFIARAATSA